MAFDLSEYVDVAARLRELRAKHPEGCVRPLNPDRPYDIVTIGDRTFVVVVSACYRTPDDPMPGVGMAWEPFPGKTPYTKDSELQNAETSSWGRAVVAALVCDTKSIASADEVRNCQPAPTSKPKKAEKPAEAAEPRPALSDELRDILAPLNEIVDDIERADTKRRFLEYFGVQYAHDLPAEKYGEASAWVDDIITPF